MELFYCIEHLDSKLHEEFTTETCIIDVNLTNSKEVKLQKDCTLKAFAFVFRNNIKTHVRSF